MLNLKSVACFRTGHFTSAGLDNCEAVLAGEADSLLLSTYNWQPSDDTLPQVDEMR